MFRNLHRRAACALALFCLPWAASAQEATGAINGRVLDGVSGRFLQGAVVRIPGTLLRDETERDGSFDLRGVAPGNYTLETSYFGLPIVNTRVTVTANQVTALTVNMTADEVITMETLEVDAEVLGQARAINQQRVAASMVNITSEELFGEMTDNNVAKALQRIPGISANSDGGTEVPRYVNIRGFDGSLNSVQLNGSRLPTSGTGQGTVYGDTARAFALDDLPANSITSIEVVKSPTPDRDGDTVGGIVNLVTKSAFDRQGRSIEYSVGADYIKLRDKVVPNGAVTFNDIYMDGRLGVSISLSYFKGDEGFDNIDYDSLPLVPQLPFNAYLGVPTNASRPTFAHEDTEYNNYEIERDRYGFAASFDYKLSDTSSIHFRPVYAYEERSEDDVRFHKVMDNDHGRGASTPPAGLAVGQTYTGSRGTAIVVAPGRGTYRTYTSVTPESGRTTLLPNGQGRGNAQYRQALNEIEPTIYSFDLGGEHQTSWGEIRWTAFNSSTSKDEDRVFVRFRRNDINWEYDRSGDFLRPDFRAVGRADPYVVPTPGASDYFVNPGSTDIQRNPRSTEEDASQLKLDVLIPFLAGTGIEGVFQTGAKARFMSRSHDREFRYFRIAAPATFAYRDYLIANDRTVADFPMPYYPDANRVITEAEGGSALYTTNTVAAQRDENFTSDYDASEDSLEAYAMGTFEVGPKLRLITGARFEHTNFEATTALLDPANIPAIGGTAPSITRENDYSVVLPGVHLRYEARSNLVARAAYTHTYGRPAFRESIAVTTFDEQNNTLSTGNPELEPYLSYNWDFSLEYFGRASYFQVAFFHKSVEGFVLQTGQTLVGESLYQGIQLDPSETYTLTTFSNEHDARNMGIEIAGRVRFIDLPAPLDGLFVDGSVTWTDSNGKYTDRPGEKLPTYGASEWLFFAGIGYEKGPISVFLSYRFRDDYLEGLESVDQQNRELGFPPDSGDDWWGPEKYWNLETSYKVTNNLRVFCNISNLAEYTNASYQSPSENGYPEDSYWHQMRVAFGVKGNF